MIALGPSRNIVAGEGRRGSLLAVVALATALGGCGGGAAAAARTPSPLLPDVRLVDGRPPVVLVARDGDPASALAVAVATDGLGASPEEEPEVAAALAGLIEGRLSTSATSDAAEGGAGSRAVVLPAWSAVRATLLVKGEAEAARAARAIREALVAPATERDLVAARKKVAALRARPLKDAALAPWARCVGAAHAMPARAGVAPDDVTLERLESWRRGAHGLGRVAIGVTGPRDVAEATATAIARAPAWPDGAKASPRSATNATPATSVFEADDPSGSVDLHLTLDLGSASRAAFAAEVLGDPRGPLAARLASLELPFRLREIVGVAHPTGGCLGVVLVPDPGPSVSALRAASVPADLAERAADAATLVRVEAGARMADGEPALDGRTLARRAGDPRDAAERAAWWGLADSWQQAREARDDAERAMTGSVTLRVPPRRAPTTAPIEPTPAALAEALTRATNAWQTPVAEGRVRAEPGQGELWVLVASPCGADAETDADAGLTALFVTAVADAARSAASDQARGERGERVESWIVPDGAGLLVHGPPRVGESPTAHARRLADLAARSFASQPITTGLVAAARAALLRAPKAPAMGALADALAPGRPSLVLPTGREDTVGTTSEAAVIARAQALRAGPVRVAVLANVDAAQGDAAARAADRWIDRRTPAAGRVGSNASSPRTCREAPAPPRPTPGTYAVESSAGAMPEALLAFPLAHAGGTTSAASATLLAHALDGEDGLLARALAPKNLAASSSAKVLGGSSRNARAAALVVRVTSPDATLDAAVVQTRALLDRLRRGALTDADLARAARRAKEQATVDELDPRARVVSLWRGDAKDAEAPSLDRLRAVASRVLDEESLVVVAARPPRPKP